MIKISFIIEESKSQFTSAAYVDESKNITPNEIEYLRSVLPNLVHEEKSLASRILKDFDSKNEEQNDK